MTRLIALALGVVLYLFAANAVMAQDKPQAMRQMLPLICVRSFEDLERAHGPISHVHGEVANELGVQLHVATTQSGRLAFMVFDGHPMPYCFFWAATDNEPT